MKKTELPTAWQALAAEAAPLGATAPPAPASLVSKLAAVMAAVERVPKRGHNQHFNYDFATESDITAAIRTELAARHLMIVPHVESLTWREIPTKASISAVCCALVRFTIHDGDSDQTLSFCIPGEGQDTGDKCVPKALTSALKFALLKLFMIPTGDDPERDEKAAPAKATRRAPTDPPVTALPSTPTLTRPHRPITQDEIAALPAGRVLLYEVQPGIPPVRVERVTHQGETLPLWKDEDIATARAACLEVVPVEIEKKISKKSGKPYVAGIVRARTGPLDASQIAF